MRYHCIHIETSFSEEWQKDIFEQQLFDLGFDTIDGEDAYIPSELWTENADKIKQLFVSTAGVKLIHVEPCADENWNATWESEHPVQELPLGIQIIPHCAFGAGHHETTSMMIESLLSADLSGKSVLDHGTGTGILAIFAKRLGASEVLAIDIDDKSVENAKENATLNHVDIHIQLGSTPPHGRYHLILANIHRNILLANMPAYASCLLPDGELWLSGFYEEDCPILQTAAEEQGLELIQVLANGEWRLMKYQNKAH